MEIKYEPDVVSYRPVYISVDGTSHYRKIDAIRHDAKVLAGTRYVEEQDSLELPDDETWMRIFNITCKEDWDYLYCTEWEQSTFGSEYTGPSWYGSIEHDGGDYWNRYEIIKIDENYCQKYNDFLNKLKNLTFHEN